MPIPRLFFRHFLASACSLRPATKSNVWVEHGQEGGIRLPPVSDLLTPSN
jgi:hypothetical protein